MTKHHKYTLQVVWTGDQGSGTSRYDAYSRDHLVRAANKPAIEASSDPAFRGDAKRHNPEELFVASLSSCHMLWYLHLCAVNGIVVTGYVDDPVGRVTWMTPSAPWRNRRKAAAASPTSSCARK